MKQMSALITQLQEEFIPMQLKAITRAIDTKLEALQSRVTHELRDESKKA